MRPAEILEIKLREAWLIERAIRISEMKIVGLETAYIETEFYKGIEDLHYHTRSKLDKNFTINE
jgi:hypothetical protein